MFFLSSSIFAFCFNFLTGIFVFLKKPKDLQNVTFGGFAVALSFWVLADLLTFFSNISAQNYGILLRGFYSVAVLVAPFFVHFTYRFCGNRESKLTLGYLYLSSFLTQICLWFFPALFFATIDPSRLEDGYVPGPLYYLFLVNVFVFLSVSYFKLGVLYRKTTSVSIRKKITYFFIAALMLFFAAIYFVCAYFFKFELRLDNIFLSIFVGFIGFTIAKHDLLDIRLIIPKFVSYGVVSLVAATVVFGELFLPVAFPVRVILILGTTVLWAIFGNCLVVALQTYAEEKWVTDFYSSEQVISEISDALSETFDSNSIFFETGDVLVHQLKLASCHYVVLKYPSDQENDQPIRYQLETVKSKFGTEKIAKEYSELRFMSKEIAKFSVPRLIRDFSPDVVGWLNSLNISRQGLIVPVHSHQRFEGLIILGPRISEAGYGKKELNFFKTIQQILGAYLDRLKPYEKIQAELAEAQDYIEQTRQAVTYASLTQGIAHEIRNPMQMIQGGFDLTSSFLKSSDADHLVENPDKKTELVEFLDLASRNIDRILEMMDRMLTHGKNTLGEKVKVQIEHEIDFAVTLCAGKFLIEEITVTKNFGETPLLEVDTNAMQQVWFNLFTNAIEAMRHQSDSKRISIVTTTGMYPNSEMQMVPGVLIDISDNGPGIPIEQRSKIFTAMYTTKVNNHGLGLDYVLRTVAAHGGYIEAADPVMGSQCHGARFKIWLPYKD